MSETKGIPEFGDYVNIEQKRHGADNEIYLHKVVRSLRSNTYVSVPVQTPAEEVIHPGKCVDVISCICCGVDETEVHKYRLEDIKLTTLNFRTDAELEAENKQLKQAMEDNCPTSMVQCDCGKHYKKPDQESCQTCQIAKLTGEVRQWKTNCDELEGSLTSHGALLADADNETKALLSTMVDLKAELDKAMSDVHYHETMDSAIGELFKKDEDKITKLEAELRRARIFIDDIIKTHRYMGHDIIADGIVSRSKELGITLPTEKKGK